MQARRKKSQKFATPLQISLSRELLIIDETPIRVASASEFQKAYQAYTRVLFEIKNHEEKVRPSYYRWLASLFGERLAKIEEMGTELFRKSALLERIRELCIFDGFSRAGAYEYASEEFASVEENDEPSGDGDDDEGYEETRGNNGEAEDDFEDFSSQSRSSEWPRAEEPRRSKSAYSEDRASQIKTLYRKLAQALHPDLSGEVTELSRQLWQETQDAYKSSDLDRLKLLWTLAELSTDSRASEVRIADIRTATAHMRERLSEAESDRRRLSRGDPSWGFNKKNKDKMAAKLSAELDHDERALWTAIQDIEENLASFEKSATKAESQARRRQGKRDRRDQIEFDF